MRSCQNTKRQREVWLFAELALPLEMAGSRSAVTEIIKDTFDMGGIEAEVTFERDSAQAEIVKRH